MQIKIKEYSAYLLCLIIRVERSRSTESTSRKKGDTDESMKIKKDFNQAPMKIARTFDLSATTGVKWTRGLSHGEKAKSLYKLWQEGYVDVSLTKKGGKGRRSIIEYIEKLRGVDTQEKKVTQEWSEEEIRTMIKQELRSILK